MKKIKTQAYGVVTVDTGFLCEICFTFSGATALKNEWNEQKIGETRYKVVKVEINYRTRLVK